MRRTLEEKEAVARLPLLRERYPNKLFPTVIGVGLEEMPTGSQRFIFRLYMIKNSVPGDRRIFKTFLGVPIKQVITGEPRFL